MLPTSFEFRKWLFSWLAESLDIVRYEWQGFINWESSWLDDHGKNIPNSMLHNCIVLIIVYLEIHNLLRHINCIQGRNISQQVWNFILYICSLGQNIVKNGIWVRVKYLAQKGTIANVDWVNKLWITVHYIQATMVFHNMAAFIHIANTYVYYSYCRKAVFINLLATICISCT